MRNSTHELVGASLAVAAAQVLETGPVETAGLAAAAVGGARLPDVDQLGARVHRRNRLERRSMLIGIVGAAVRLPLVAFAGIVSHRALTHSALACVAAPVGAAFVGSAVGPSAAALTGVGVAIGYAAHVAADACTPGGVSLWAPLSRKRVWLLPSHARVPTGSGREAALAAAAGFSAVAVILLT